MRVCLCGLRFSWLYNVTAAVHAAQFFFFPSFRTQNETEQR